MNHWIIAPVVLPALLAPLIAFVMRYDMPLARTASLAGTVSLLAIAIGLTVTAAGGETHIYRLGDWPAPFGIVLVLDRLSALMLLLTSLLALIVLVHAVATGWDARGRHFHALFQFQLMGINGAFLTGDVFNLFVFFEVLLIASYGLMIHSGGRARMRAGLQYVVMNLAGPRSSSSRWARSTARPARSTSPTSPCGWPRCRRRTRHSSAWRRSSSWSSSR
jgi:multicomponent K+:H+ antiporter subunit D